MGTGFFIVDFRYVGEGAQSEPFGKCSRPDGLQRLFPLDLVNVQCGGGGEEYFFCSDGPDMKDGLVSGFGFFQNFLFGENIVNPELELDRLELSVVVQNIVIIADCDEVIVEFGSDDNLLALRVLG